MHCRLRLRVVTALAIIGMPSLAEQIRRARALGANGFTIFPFGSATADLLRPIAERTATRVTP
ncbi:MAG: hypothetical protein LLG00_12605 [Planctomycetaceae bacterium]|nr:hypothetical protein [Planctomycetaceae bacterium]